jgi:hypothetical protein
MCGYFPATEKSFTVGTVAAPLLGPNPRRHSLIIWVPSGNRVTLSQRSDITLNAGITISNSNSPFVMTADAFGDWLKRQIFAIGDVAAIVGGYVEVTEIDLPIPTMPGPNFQKQEVRNAPQRRVGTSL